MATPHVAGAWALLKQQHPSASVASVLSALQSTGTPVLDDGNGLTKPRINIAAAASALSGGGDTTRPGVSLTSPAAGAIVRGSSVTLSANATDNVGVHRVEFLVNGSRVGTDSTAPYNWSWNSKNTRDGYKTITAGAFDAAGNSATSSRTVIVDNTYPQTTITSGPPSVTRYARATFRFVSSESNSTFRCSIDGRAYTLCSSPKTYFVSRGRTHTFRVYAVGAAGAAIDRDSTPAVRTWKVVRR